MKLQLDYQDAVAVYFDKALIESTQRLRRVKIGGSERYYYIDNEDGSKTFFIGVTSASKISIPQSAGLLDWMMAQGSRAQADRVAMQAAAYGTCMHRILLELYLIGGKLKMEDVDAMVRGAAYDFGLKQEDYDTWVREIRRDLLAFAQFVEDYKVRPIAVEFPIADADLGLGGTIDLPCYITVKEKGFFGEVYKTGERKGEPKETSQEREIIAIIDLKSGRKGFYEEHEFQLHAYRRMWNNRMPNLQIERVYDWSPKEWKTTPSYNFTDQTDSIYAEDETFNAVLSIARRKAKKVENHRELVIAEELDRTLPISEQFKFISVEESL